MESLKDAIILEGITGSGKSKQVELIKSRYDGMNINFCDSTSPIYDATKQARQSLRDAQYPFMPEALLHQFTNWMKLYEQRTEADLAVVDRFSLSNLVYFLARCKMLDISVDLPKVRAAFLQPLGFDFLADTTTLYFDCPPSEAQRRTLLRKERTQFDFDLQSAAHEIYRREVAEYPYQIHIIDSSGDAEKSFAKVRSILEDKLKEEKDGTVRHVCGIHSS